MGFADSLLRKVRGWPDVAAMRAAQDVDGLLQAASHSHDRVKREAEAAIDSMWTTDGDRLRARLLAAVEKDVLPAASAIGRARDQSSVEPLLVVLAGSGNDGVRRLAIIALGKIGDGRATAPLLQVLRNETKRAETWDTVATTSWAAMALGDLGQSTTEVIEALVVASACEFPRVRESARFALKKLGRADLADAAFQAFIDANTVPLLKEAMKRGLNEVIGKKLPP